MKYAKYYPLLLAAFVWHLRCFYELQIVNPIWWAWPLPIDGSQRVCRIIAIYLFIAANYVYYKLLNADNDSKDGYFIAFLNLIGFFMMFLSYSHFN